MEKKQSGTLAHKLLQVSVDGGVRLRMLPERVVAPMLKLFNQAEQEGEGLPQHRYASVAMIAKCLNPQSAGDCRPITVLSCIYRA